MIKPEILLIKYYSSEVLNNHEQDQIKKYGMPLIAHKVSYKTSVYDKATNTVRNEETLVISILDARNIEFKINDVIEIKKQRWTVDYVELPDPFVILNKKYTLTLKR